MADPKWKKGKYKRARSVCSSSSSDYSFTGDCGNESKRFKQVSTWTIDDLEKLGIRYDSEESPLSELLSKVRCKTERHVNQKPVPTFISCLDHYTRKSLKFSLADDIADYESAQDELIKVNSKLAEVNLAIEKIREEDSELIDHDRINRILFETWSSRVRDFMLAYQRFIEEQIFKPYRTKTTYVQLFSKFTGIFLLNPEPGDKRTVFFGEETVASVPDICFILHAVNSHFRVFWTITLTEEQRSESKVKDTGLKRKNSKDSEEKFDLRESLPKNLLAQHGGQLVVEREKTALRPCVLGTICAATEIIFTYMDMSADHLHTIITKGETSEHTSVISYTRPYNFLLEEDRKEVLSFLFWLGYVQTASYNFLSV